MKKRKLTPDLRFDGFNGEWSEAILSDYLVASKEKNHDNQFSKEDVLSISREFGVVNQVQYQGRSLAGESVSGYGVASTNDVIYTKSPLRDQPYGIIKTNKGESGIVSALYAVYHPKENVDPGFTQTYFEYDKRLNDYLRPIVHKGAKNTLNIGDDDALLGKVFFPKKEEQIQITSSFETIDKEIYIQREKCEKLRNIKKALLISLFPKGNNRQPKIRLKGFSGDWKEHPLSDFLDISKEKNSLLSFDVSDVLSVSQYFGVVNQIEFQGRSFAGESLNGYKVLDIGQVVYTKSPLKEQPYGIIKSNQFRKGIVSSLYAVYNCVEADSRFIEYYFCDTNRLNQYLRVLIHKGAKNTMNISDEVSISGLVIFPQKDEQKAIADLLNLYDQLIQLNDQKLEHLKNLKKALLDKMFV